MEPEPSWQRQLFVGLSVLLAVGLLIGGVVAVVAVKAADYAGIGSNAGSSGPVTPEPLLPTTGDATNTSPPRSPTPPPTGSPSTAQHHHQRHHRPQHSIVLSASPLRAGSMQHINLTGTYAGHDGVTLQVQSSVGKAAWSDFPTTVDVSSGTFATYVQTGQPGPNHFRLIDKATGATSNTVTVMIG